MKEFEIAAILKENKVDFDKNFAKLGKEKGYTGDGCYALGQRIREDLEKIIKEGIANGFNRYKNSIKTLTATAVKMSERNANKNLTKFKQDVEKAEKDIKLSQMEEHMEIKKVVYDYIDSSLQALGYIKAERVTDPEEIQTIDESGRILKAIRGEIEIAPDGVSTNALEKANTIIDKIRDWREDAAALFFPEESVKTLKGALSEAKEWKTMVQSTKRGLFSRNTTAKEEDIPVYQKDELGYMALVPYYTRQFNTFKERLELYKKDNGLSQTRVEGSVQGIEALEKEIEEKENEYKELQRKVKEIKAQYRNGEIERELAEEKLEDIQDDMDYLEDDINDLREDLRDKRDDRVFDKDDVRLKKQNIEMVERIVNQVMKNRQDHVIFGCLAKEVDFKKLTNVLTGSLNEQTLQALADMQENLDFVMDRARHEAEEYQRVARERMQARNEALREQREQRRERKQEERTRQREMRNSNRRRSRISLDDEEEGEVLDKKNENDLDPFGLDEEFPEEIRLDR